MFCEYTGDVSQSENRLRGLPAFLRRKTFWGLDNYMKWFVSPVLRVVIVRDIFKILEKKVFP